MRWLTGLLAVLVTFAGLIVAPSPWVAAQADPGAVSRPSIVKITYQAQVEDRRGNPVLAEITGSGVLYDPRGFIATNMHVIAEATGPVDVSLIDGRVYQGVVVGRDRVTDVAVVKIEGDNLPVAAIGDSNTVQIGQRVLLIGHSPLVRNPTQGDFGTVTGLDGVFLVPGTGSRHRNLIRTNVIGSPGDSGGALLDQAGRVIGMPVLRRPELANGRFVEGLHIPVNRVMAMAQAIMAFGRVPRAYIGTSTSTVTPEIAATYGFPVNKGVLVQFIDGDGPAFAAGIRRGFIIQSVDGQEVIWQEQFAELVQAHQPDAPIALAGVRPNGQPFAVQFNTIQRPDDDDSFDRLSYE